MKYGSDKERTSLVGAQIWPDSAALGSFSLFAQLIFGPPPLLDGDHLDLDPGDDDDDNNGAGPWQRIWFKGLYHCGD